MRTITLTTDLTYDDHTMHGNNEQARAYFYDQVLLGPHLELWHTKSGALLGALTNTTVLDLDQPGRTITPQHVITAALALSRATVNRDKARNTARGYRSNPNYRAARKAYRLALYNLQQITRQYEQENQA